MRHMRDDTGAVAVIVAILMVVLVGFTALAVDVGYVMTIRRQLQTAADAAALAGCRVLADGGTEAEALAEADGYAARNAFEPADSLVMLTTPPDTEVTPTWIQVTCQRESPLFFARVLGIDTTPIRASARAEIAYLTGVEQLVPWSVPVIQATRVTARIGGGAEVALNPAGGGWWEGMVPVPAGASTTGKPVEVIAYNNQRAYPDGSSDYPDGVPEPLLPAADVVVRDAAAPVQDVYLSRNVATAGEHDTVTLYVRATARPDARFDNKNINLSPVVGDPTLYSATLNVPTSERLVASYPVNVEVKSAGYTLRDAATLVVRRATYPFEDVEIGQEVFTAPVSGSVEVRVKMRELVKGNPYELKVVGGGAEVGNYCSLDFTQIFHTPNWRNPAPTEYPLSGNPYYDYLETGFPDEIHIDDTVWTQPGNMSGPQTASALAARFAGDNRTYAQWSAVDPPTSSRRIVYVPVMEKLQFTTGATPLRVVNFAAFYIEPDSDLRKDVIRGLFIDYVLPSSSSSPTPPAGGFSIKTVHLVTPTVGP